MTPTFSRLLNGLGLILVGVVLLIAFYAQLAEGELPCPLCILQRSAFAAVMAGLALNVCCGPRPSHYGLIIVSALAGAAIAARQTLLHIVPGTGTYGAPILGLHLYTWALVLFLAIVLGSALLLLFDRQFATEGGHGRATRIGGASLGVVGAAGLVLALLMTLGNGVSTVLECAGGLCPDDPQTYLLLDGTPSPSDGD